MMALVDPKWHIALTEPQSERHASEELRTRGYETYLPILPKTIRHFRNGPNRARTVIRPMFPGYLFVCDTMLHGWHSLCTTPGIRTVHSLMRRCGSQEYAYATPSEMAQIRTTEAWLFKEKQGLAFNHSFKIGEATKVMEGSLTGFLAEVETLDDHERIGLLVSLFGRKVRVSLPAEYLASAS